MSSIKDINAVMDEGLDKPLAKAEAAATQIKLFNDDLNSYIKSQQKLKGVVLNLQAKLDEAVPDEARTKIQDAFEHLVEK